MYIAYGCPCNDPASLKKGSLAIRDVENTVGGAANA